MYVCIYVSMNILYSTVIKLCPWQHIRIHSAHSFSLVVSLSFLFIWKYNQTCEREVEDLNEFFFSSAARAPIDASFHYNSIKLPARRNQWIPSRTKSHACMIPIKWYDGLPFKQCVPAIICKTMYGRHIRQIHIQLSTVRMKHSICLYTSMTTIHYQ